MSKSIVLVDYGVGNINSIKNMLKKAGADKIILSSSNEDIYTAEKLILPGVGSFDYGMTQLNQNGLIEALNQRVLADKIPILGICLGAQLLTKSSEEGKLPGLGWIDAVTTKFQLDAAAGYRVPHMGWNEVSASKKSALLEDMPVDSKFYFVHSYHMVCANREDELLSANYSYDFTAAVEHENIMGVQFHPEKSHKYGMKLLGNFVNNF